MHAHWLQKSRALFSTAHTTARARAHWLQKPTNRVRKQDERLYNILYTHTVSIHLQDTKFKKYRSRPLWTSPAILDQDQTSTSGMPKHNISEGAAPLDDVPFRDWLGFSASSGDAAHFPQIPSVCVAEPTSCRSKYKCLSRKQPTPKGGAHCPLSLDSLQALLFLVPISMLPVLLLKPCL